MYVSSHSEFSILHLWPKTLSLKANNKQTLIAQYGVKHMVKDHSDSERENLLSPHGLLFPISSKDSFIYIIPQTGYHIPWPLLHKLWSTGWNKK